MIFLSILNYCLDFTAIKMVKLERVAKISFNYEKLLFQKFIF